jgi:hypothetical protein
MTVPDLDPIAVRYHKAGWHPFPLPPGSKGPPPEGRTGYEGTDFTEAELDSLDWTGNIGLRMPDGIIGLDVDAYRGGRDTLREMADRLGKLPNTFISHSGRDDGSGIRFYNVPVGLSWVATLPGMDIIQRTHRYAAVWPSTHPEGRTYAWHDQDAAWNADHIPLVEDLPDLPWAWIAELSRATQGDVTARPQAASGPEVENFLSVHTVAHAPGYTSVICQHFIERRTQGYSRHDTMQHCLTWACEHVRAGVMAAQPTIEALAELWTDAVSDNPRRAELVSDRRTTEFSAMVRHAVGKANAKTDPELHKLHDDVAGIPMQTSTLIDVYQQPSQQTPNDAPELPALPIDWRAFSKRDPGQHRWLVEQLWPEGRGVALWADAKEGKSELALWAAGCLAQGVHPWTGAPVEPVPIAYFDFEMTEDDLDERLSDFGFDTDLLDNLRYFLLPPLHAMDEEAGGREVATLAQHYGVAGVVIDTFGRAVLGEEDKADTVRAFYRHTGIRLKQLGIGYLRTDHAGKDRTRGQRGSSAKRDDVDIVWSLRRTQAGVSLNCKNSSRLSWVPTDLKLDRLVDPNGIVSYRTPVVFASTPAGVTDKARELDRLGVPLDAGRPAAIAALKAAGLKPGRNEVISAALTYRRERPNPAGTASGTAPGDSQPGQPSGQDSDCPADLFSDQDIPPGDSSGGQPGDSP